MPRGSAVIGLLIAGGLATVPAPLAAQPAASSKSQPAAQQVAPAILSAQRFASGALPANPNDFLCYSLLQDRREGYLQSGKTSAADAQQVNNLAIVSAFYAGRLSHYFASDAAGRLVAAEETIAGANNEDLDKVAQQCTDFYLQVMRYLGDKPTTAKQ